jgi:hypothetical protein
MFLASSNDLGKTFTPAVKLGQGTWKLDACPMDGGALAVGADGHRATIWRRDKQVFLTASDGRAERELGSGQQPWVALNHRGAFAIWLAQRPGDLYLAMPDKRPQVLARQARDPVISAAQSGKGTVVVAWETEENGTPVIRVRSIADDERQ